MNLGLATGFWINFGFANGILFVLLAKPKQYQNPLAKPKFIKFPAAKPKQIQNPVAKPKFN